MPDNNDQKELTAKIGFLEAELDSLSAKLRGMSATGGGDQEERYGWSVPIYKSSLNLSKFAFGYTVSGNVVTVTAGKIRHGVRTAGFVDAAEVTISDDHTWIWVDYAYGGTASIGSGTTEPVSTETNILVPLHQWRLENERVSLEKIHHIGDIIIPAAYA